jgi:uncharacterized protein (TIGR03067 family)
MAVIAKIAQWWEEPGVVLLLIAAACAAGVMTGFAYRRGWLRFTLRDLLWATLVVAIGLAWWASAIRAPSPANDYHRIQGLWKTVSLEHNGVDAPFAPGLHWRFQGDQLLHESDYPPLTEGVPDSVTFLLNDTTSPKRINVIDDHAIGVALKIGIYELEGDDVQICETDSDRPDKFETSTGDKRNLWRLRRVRE